MELVEVSWLFFALIATTGIVAGLLVVLAFRKESQVLARLSRVHGLTRRDFGGFWGCRVSIWRVSKFMEERGGKDEVLMNLVTSGKRLYGLAFCLCVLVLILMCFPFFVAV